MANATFRSVSTQILVALFLNVELLYLQVLLLLLTCYTFQTFLFTNIVGHLVILINLSKCKTNIAHLDS